MNSIKLIFLVFCIAFSVQSSVLTDDIPDIKLSLSLAQLNALKTNVLKPLIETKLNNLFLAGLFAIDVSSIPLLQFNIAFSNITLVNHCIDWNNIKLSGTPEGNLRLTLTDITIKIQNLYDFHGPLGVHLQGKGSFRIVSLSLDLTIGFKATQTASKWAAYIVTSSINYEIITLQMDQDVVAKLLNLLLSMRAILDPILNSFISKNLSTQIETITSNLSQLVFNFPFVQVPYLIHFNLVTPPQVQTSGNYQYLNVPINFLLQNNNTKEFPPITEIDNMPNRSQGQDDAEIFISNSIINQIVWMVMDSGLIHLTLDDTSPLLASSPLRLNTSAISILLPGIPAKYGKGLGMYLTLGTASKFSNFYIRGGRFIGVLSAELDFTVDTNTAGYPALDAPDCASCIQAVKLNATLFVGLHFETQDQGQKLIANLIDIQVFELDILAQDQGLIVDKTQLSDLLNDLCGSFIPLLNVNLNTGFKNPLFGKMGIDEMNIWLGKDYFFNRLHVTEEIPKAVTIFDKFKSMLSTNTGNRVD